MLQVPHPGWTYGGYCQGWGAVRRRCPETDRRRAAKPQYSAALAIGGKLRLVLEAPSGPGHSQRITVASGTEEVVGATGGPWNRRALEGLANEEDAEEFARVLGDSQRDLENSAVVSVDNLLEGVSTARK